LFPLNLEAVLFDAGGTLVRIDYAFVAQAARQFGFAFDENDLLHGEAAARHAIDARAGALHNPEDSDASRVPEYFANLLRGAGVPEVSVDPLLRLMTEQHAESNLWRVPLEGASETLRGLRAMGIRTAVVSNSDGRVRAKLHRLGLTDHLEFVVDSHEEGVEKPDAEIFQRALARMGVDPERAAYIGDIYSIDTVGARAAGMHPVLIDPTGAYRSSDCMTIATLSELLVAFAGRVSGLPPDE
jgi:putative hydrolase of the HAD superfamily